MSRNTDKPTSLPQEVIRLHRRVLALEKRPPLIPEPTALARGAEPAGVPPGGRAGQVLAKKSDDDYDLEWVDP